MKVWTVEWHGDYDGGEVYKVFDSKEKADACLAEIIKLGSEGSRRSNRNCNRLHKVKPPEPHIILDSKGKYVKASEAVKRWDRAWQKWVCFDYPFQYVWDDYSVREYEVL